MCYGDHYCEFEEDKQRRHLIPEAASSACAEARNVLGRDVVLGAAKCSGPRGGKMSSTTPPSAQQAATTATLATTPQATPTIAFSVTTSPTAAGTNHAHTATVFASDTCPSVSTTIAGTPAAVSVSFPSSTLQPPSKSPPVTAGTSDQLVCSAVTLPCKNNVAPPSSRATVSTGTTTVTESSTPVHLQQQQQSNPAVVLLTQSSAGESLSLYGEPSLLVPSVCWEEEFKAATSQEAVLAVDGMSMSSGVYCALPQSCASEVRPPVLGEEERIGQEEDLSIQQNIMMQGDGWGECPAVVGSAEGTSPPDDCSGGRSGGAVGSLELSGGGSSSSSGGNPAEWPLSLERLLADPAGVAVFKQFLDVEQGCSNSLDFFFACKGLGKQSPDNLRQLLPLIWKKFIRNFNVLVSSKTHAALAEKIHGNALSADMFKTAQKEVFDRMMNTTYPAFLQSQHYLEQIQHYHMEQQKRGSGMVDEQHRSYQSSYCTQTRFQDMQLGEIDYSSVSHSKQSSLSGYDSNAGFPAEKREGFSDPVSSPMTGGGGWCTAGKVYPGGPKSLSTVYEHEGNESTAIGAADPNNVARLIHGIEDLSLGARQNIGYPRADFTSLSVGDTNRSQSCAPMSGDLLTMATKRLNLTPSALAATMGQRAAPLPKPGAPRTGQNPYHAAYGRGHYASRQDSEGQSFSSGAHTDDTRSYTDSSMDGTAGGHGGRSTTTSSTKQLRKHRIQMKESLRLNEELRNKQQLQQQQSNLMSPRGAYPPEFVVPRTQFGVCPASNMARYPEQFATVLTQKLEAVLRDRDAQERVQQAFKKIQSGGSADEYRREHAVNSLPPLLLVDKIIQKIPLDEEDSGQAILDQHVSRVWQDSNNGSPSYSPSTPPHYPPPPAQYPGAMYPHNSAAPGAGACSARTKTGGPLAKTGRSFAQQQYVLQQKGAGAAPTATPHGGYPPTAGSMTTSKSWHQARYKEYKGPDVYSTFSSDSGNVADFCESGAGGSGGRNTRRVPKTRSVPDHMMDNCAGSGSERYLSSSGCSGSRGRVAGSGGAELTDSGVSVISDSRHSLLTATITSSTSSSVKHRVETWLQDSSEKNKLSSSCSSIRAAEQQQQQHMVGSDRAMPPPVRRGPSSVGGGGSSKWQAGGGGNGVDHRQDPARRRHRGGAPAPSALSNRLPTSTAAPPPAQPACYGGDCSTPGATTTTAATAAATTNTAITNTGGSGGNSDRNTSSSNGSTMRKQQQRTGSSKHGGGGSDSHSSCGRSSDSATAPTAESTTVVYSFCDDSVPFVIKIPARTITLRRFKQHLPKRGNYRFFFKKHCEEFGVIQEEMTEDEEILPMYEGRIFAQIRKAD